MRRLFKYLFGLVLLLAIGFVGYAMLSDLPAPVRDTVVTLSPPEGSQ